MMNTKIYNRLRYVTQIVLPAAATFIVTICGIWKIPYGEQIGMTAAAVVTLLSGILGASSAIYDKEGGKYNAVDYVNSSDNLHELVHVSGMESAECSEEEG